MNDTNLQRHYVGDRAGNEELARLGIPPSALIDGSLPNTKTLFKRSLYEVKALYDSQQYLKNPNATEAAAARLQAQVLDGIARVANGQPVNSSSKSSLTTEPAANNDTNQKKKTSPAVAIAEALLLSQKAAVQEQETFKAILDLQKQENQLKKKEVKHNIEEAKLMGREERTRQMQLGYKEHSCTTKLL
jgi:hypothetical protein